jgi:23S rRNA pseudouridine955/2504/2580 synthase
VEPGLLHRLDQGTSGVVVIARSVRAFAGLLDQFESGRVRKEYLAICVPTAAVHSTRLSVASRFAPYGPGRAKVRVVMPFEHRVAVLREASPDTYQTEAEIAERGGGCCLVRCTTTRGFRHQIRVHLAHLGFPIAGDDKYGDFEWNRELARHGLKRLFLHAHRIRFAHPQDGRDVVVEAPLAPDLAAFVARLDAAGEAVADAPAR